MTCDAVFTFGNSIAMPSQIADFISKILGIQWISGVISDDQNFDRLIVVAGGAPFAGSDVLDHLGRAVARAECVIWVTNDYQVSLPSVTSRGESPYRACFRQRAEQNKREVLHWSTCESIAGVDNTINWNAICMANPIMWKQYCDRKYADHAIYYGYWRKGRAEAFDKYLRYPHIQTAISYPTGKSAVNFGMFVNTMVKHLPKFYGNLKEELGQFGIGIYLEDKVSHSNYHSPACRFYEMLGAGLPILFEPDACWTMHRGGYAVKYEWTMSNEAKIRDFHTQREWIQLEQSKLWYNRAVQEFGDLGSVLQQRWRSL